MSSARFSSRGRSSFLYSFRRSLSAVGGLFCSLGDIKSSCNLIKVFHHGCTFCFTLRKVFSSSRLCELPIFSSNTFIFIIFIFLIFFLNCKGINFIGKDKTISWKEIQIKLQIKPWLLTHSPLFKRDIFSTALFRYWQK